MTFNENLNENEAEPIPSPAEETPTGTDRQPLGMMDDDVQDITPLTDQSLQLEADLAAAKVDIAEWHDRYLRKVAEFDNYRKRVEKEKADLRILSQSAILQGILPVVDGFDRALQYFGSSREGAGSAGSASSIDQYREGVELLYRQVLDTLAQTGATPIDAQGRMFDPNLHEALSREETAAVEEGTVVKELRRGYMFKDKLLRPAQVIVAVHPKNPES